MDRNPAVTGTDVPKSSAQADGYAPLSQSAASGAVCEHCGSVHPGGRFVAGCPGPRLDTGKRSQLVRSGAATGTETEVAQARLALRTELGEVGIIKGSLADAFTELGAVRDYLGGRLGDEGPLTAKGRTRALLSAYLNVVDRQVRIAQLLGLDRRVKNVSEPFEAALAREPEAR